MKKVQLYSGGMDSYIISKLWKPDVKLYIDYGTEQTAEEKKHLPEDVIIKELPIGEFQQNDGICTIPLRNLIFAAIAINYGDEVAIGGLASDLHFDKKPEFANLTTQLFNSVMQKERDHRTVKISVPFANYTKTDLVVEFLKNGGTIAELQENSWSCHTPNGDLPCYKCQACKAREKAINDALKIMEEYINGTNKIQ